MNYEQIQFENKWNAESVLANVIDYLNVWYKTSQQVATVVGKAIDLIINFNRPMPIIKLSDAIEKTLAFREVTEDERVHVSSLIGYMQSQMGFKGDEFLGEIGEIIGYMIEVDLFRTYQGTSRATGEPFLLIERSYIIPEEWIEQHRISMFDLPLICEPYIVSERNQSCYEFADYESVMNSKFSPQGRACHDVLNTLNRTALSLNKEMLLTMQESVSESKEKWNDDKKCMYSTNDYLRDINLFRDSKKVYLDIIETGNVFYIPHQNCKRGRTYCHGYHINYQGYEYKKAIVELHHKEFIEVTL